MAFSVSEEGGLSPIVHLKDSESCCAVEIYSFGALLNAFTITAGGVTHNIIDGFSSPQQAQETITAGFKSAKLSPFVCRLSAGKYVYNGTEHSINKFFLGTEAIHGLIYDAPFAVKEKGADSENAWVVLGYEYNNKNEGFPFKYYTEVTYSLKKGGELQLTTAVTNTGESEMPLSDGWHPYFTLGGSVNSLTVQLNAKQMLEFSDKLVPTGNLVDTAGFSTPKLLGETFFDNCFVVDNIKEPACIIKNEANGLTFTITAVTGYPYLQVYTPPHRKSIAIENLSAAPDAFNNGIGLIIGKPFEQYTFVTHYKLQFEHN
jgi:aldose 1-epimerase